eukprot:gene32284-43118_t
MVSSWKPGSPCWATRSVARLFGREGRHVYRAELASKLALVERHAAAGKREQGMVLADADIAARIELRPALTHENVARNDGLAAELLHAEEPGYEHQMPMPDVPPPEDLPDRDAMSRDILPNMPKAVRAYYQRERPIEMRPVMLQHYTSREKLEPKQNIWIRTTGPVPADRATQAAVLAYLSDMTLLDTSTFAHGRAIFDRDIQAASLDHAMWFHRSHPLDDWMLYTQDSPSTQGSRGFTRGSLFARDGTLIASVAQEGLIRLKRSPAE